MKRLNVLLDEECALCHRCRLWLLRQDAYLELRFIALQSPDVARLFPGLKEWPQLDLREKLVVISDDGLVYQGQNAWIMCLYALRDYREWSQRLAHPALQPFARRVCEAVSSHRLALSKLLGAPVAEWVKRFDLLERDACHIKGGC